MKTVKELSSKIQNAIWKEQEPKQLSNLIQEILIRYKECYNEYMQKIRAIIEPNEEENVNNILRYIQRDYQETVEMLKTIQLAEEGYRKKEIEETIIPIVERIANSIENVNEESFKEEEVALKEDIIKAKRNKKYISEIKTNVISELKSSKSMIIQKSKDIKADKKQLKELQEELEIKIQQIIKDATVKLDEMQSVIKQQDIEIYNQILQLLEQYYDENTGAVEKGINKKREEFIQRMSENIQLPRIESDTLSIRDDTNVLEDRTL